MNDQVPRAEERLIEQTGNEDATSEKRIERVVAERSEMNDAVVDEIVDDDGHDGQVVDDQTSSSRRDPAIVKDENVPLHSCPCEKSDLNAIEGVVLEYPEDVEGRRREHGHAGVIVVQDPDDVGELVDDAKKQEHNDDVIVQSATKGSIDEQIVEDEDRADERENIRDQVGPESDAG